MRGEYLLFDLLVLAAPLLIGAWRPAWFYDKLGAALRAVGLVGIPFVAWDAAVAGRHWWFNPRYVLGVEVLGLPVEEVLFFLAIPLACLFTWETFFTPSRVSTEPPRREGLRWIDPLSWSLVPLGAVVAAGGLEYTGYTLIALGALALLDHALGTGLVRWRRAHAFFAVVVLLTAVFNGYLTARPVVLYAEAYRLGIRVGTIPVEDFGYGIALVGAAVSIYQWQLGRARRPSWPARGIERALGGYRHVVHEPDPRRPLRVEGPPRRVAVVGAGLAGIGAASRLAERGLSVTLFERNDYLGGKLGAWTDRASDGREVQVEHGFHAFFRHYYNLDAFLRERGIHARLRPIGDYVIVDRQGGHTGFAGVNTTPGLNLLSLARHGLYDLWPVVTGPAGRHLDVFLRYDRARTFERFDQLSFARFAERAELPPSLMLVFNTFARAFFADADRISMAEMIKSFHFYYLSHDHGLEYDYLEGRYHDDVLEPLRRHLLDHGARLRTGAAVEGIGGEPGAFEIDGERFDDVVLAADAASTRAVVEASPLAERHPALRGAVAGLRAGQRYCVLRVWVEAELPAELPVFVIVERDRLLDAMSVQSRIDGDCRRWAEKHRGSVLELHCYAVPDDVPDDEVRAGLLEEAAHVFPALRGARVVRTHQQLRADFTAFHTGMHASRPGIRSPVPGVWFAGDWVELPFPAMLMEAAYSSGLLVANEILAQVGVRGFPVCSVPPRGLLASVPERPSR